MNVCVFNIANINGSIKASGPSLRVISVGLPYIQSKELTHQLDVETRLLPVSRGPNSPDGSGCDIHWKAISNQSLTALDEDAAKIQLQIEYDSIRTRVNSWNKLRDDIDAEVSRAAQERILRSVNQVRAEALLMMLKAREPCEAGDNHETRKEMTTFVPRLSRDMETVGQTWALIAIMGDSEYYNKKSQILDSIGRAYFAFIKEATQKDDDNEAEAAWHSDEKNSLDIFLTGIVQPLADALGQLSQEPLVALFEASDDPDALNKKAELLSKARELKHADIAIVRMYSWLNLRTAQSHRIQHKTRGNNATAAEFFTAMRASTTQ
jgi:hypothetical protein